MKALSIGFDVPFIEAAMAASQRGVALPEDYYGRLTGIARQRAFSVQGIAVIEQLQAVRDSLTTAMNEGLSFREWKRKMAVVDLALPDHRLDNIWRTNLQGNYLRGQWEQFIENRATRGYLQYDAINDSRTRPSHLAHDGVIRAVDDPFWKTHSPPLGYRCRCSLVSLTEAQAKARSGPMQGLNKLPKTEDGLTAEADPGFDFNPAQDRLDEIRAMVQKRTKVLPPRLKKAAAKFEPKWDTTGEDHGWHARSFGTAPEDMQRVALKADRVEVRVDPREGAYCTNTHIQMGNSAKTEGAAWTWRHEFGHWLDRTTTPEVRQCLSRDFVDAMEKDAKELSKKAGAQYWKVQEPLRGVQKRANELQATYLRARDEMIDLARAERVNRIVAKLDELGFDARDALNQIARYTGFDLAYLENVGASANLYEALVAYEQGDGTRFITGISSLTDVSNVWKRGGFTMLSDLIGSATYNRVAGHPVRLGHGNDYYDEDSILNRSTECFANLTALLGEGSPFWSKITERFAPNMTKVFKKWIKTRAD